MPTLGVSELLVIFMILVLVFGASRLPQLGEGLGKTIRSFKRGLSSDDKIQVTPANDAKAAPGEASKAPAASGSVEEPADAEIIDKV